MSATRFAKWTDDDVLQELDENGEGLTPWELDFLNDVMKRRRTRRNEGLKVLPLTPTQRAKLEQLAEERLD